MYYKDIKFESLRAISNIPYHIPYSASEKDIVMYVKTYKKKLTKDILDDYIEVAILSTNIRSSEKEMFLEIYKKEKLDLSIEEIIDYSPMVYSESNGYSGNSVHVILSHIVNKLVLTEDIVTSIIKELNIKHGNYLIGLSMIDMIMDHTHPVKLDPTFIEKIINNGGGWGILGNINKIIGENIVVGSNPYESNEYKVYKRDYNIDKILEE